MERTSARQIVSKQTGSEVGLLGGGWFDLHALLDRFTVQFGAIAKSTGKFIVVTTSEQTPRYFSGNHLRLFDVLNNVAAYALTHMDEGCILFDIHAYPIEQGKLRIEIVIVTTGIGLPHHKVSTIFLHDYSTSEQGDTSLFTAKTIASLMGGDLTIENTFGWGTRYIINMIMESEVLDYKTMIIN